MQNKIKETTAKKVVKAKERGNIWTPNTTFNKVIIKPKVSEVQLQQSYVPKEAAVDSVSSSSLKEKLAAQLQSATFR